MVRRPPRRHRRLRARPGDQGRARATVTRRLSTIAGFYKYAVEEELLDHSPAAHVRRPRLDYDSRAVGLDRNELGALLVAAGLGPPAEHALISLLALDGLRVSEATGADIEHLGLERGHRTLTVTRKGGKVVTIPLAPPTARAIDVTIGERTDGPVFLAGDRRRLDSHGAGRIVRKVARRAGIAKTVTPHTLQHAFITAALDAGCRCGTCKRRRRTPIRGPRSGMTGPAAAWTGTRPTSWPPTSRAPPGSPLGLGNLSCLAAIAAKRKVTVEIGHGPQPQPEREPPLRTADSASADRQEEYRPGAFCAIGDRAPRRSDGPGADLRGCGTCRVEEVQKLAR
jgi:Phage integrase family